MLAAIRCHVEMFDLTTPLMKIGHAWISRCRPDMADGMLLTELRRALVVFTHQANKVTVPFFQSLVAEIEA